MIKTLPRLLCNIALPVMLVASTITHVQSQEKTSAISSPDKKLKISFKTGLPDKKEAADQLVYEVMFNGKQLLKPSALSLAIQGFDALGANVHIVNSKTEASQENYTLVVGKASSVHDQYNSLQLEVEENSTPKRKLTIEARAYNDAVAFRYVVPEQETTKDGYQLTNENTEFHFAADATTYAQVLPHYKSMYESEYLKLPVTAFSNQGGVKSSVLIGLPMMAEVPGVGWLAIAETDLLHYSSMYLTNPGGGWSGHTMLSRLSPRLDSSGMAVIGKGALHSAWRIIMVGEQPGRLLESNAVMSLSPAPETQDLQWIKPGKASWDWWSGSLDKNGESAFTTDNMKRYVDFAAKSGLEYMLVDAGWTGKDITKMNGKVDLPELVKYAAAKNVKVWVWLYGGYVAKQAKEAFSLYEQWGVAGVKIDFIERDDQEGIDFYYETAKTAAAHHLMIDFHGCTKPFGLERTYPNVMNYEAILGMEQSKGGTRDNPENRVMLAFTRMLTGPMDFTPGGFNNVTREAFVARDKAPMVMGTRAHHLALYAVYQAQFEMVSDYPEAYEGQPDFEFIKKIPASWDEIKVVNGIPGEYITVARRKGNEWYLGSITNWNEHSLSIPLSFLGKGSYTAEIYADAADASTNPKHTSRLKQTVSGKAVLQAKLVTGGGYAVRFVPVK